MSDIEQVTPAKGVLARTGNRLDLKVGSEADIFRVVAQGISIRTYNRVASRLQIPNDLVAPESTVRRRLGKSSSRFTEAESERLVRVTRVFAEAVELFGDEKTALDWCNTPADYLQGQPPVTPMMLAATDAGARLVESHIKRTAYGRDRRSSSGRPA